MTRRRTTAAAALVAGLLALLFLFRSTAVDPAPADVGGLAVPVPTRPALATTPSERPAPDGVPEADAPEIPAADGEEDLAALAEQLASDPNTHVICELSIPVERSTGYLAVGGHSDMNGRLVQVVDGKAYLPLVYDLGELNPDVAFTERTGHFTLEGYGPVSIAWSDPPEDGGTGTCTADIEPETGMASITGTLTLDPSGDAAAGAWLEGCGNVAFADERGIVHMDIVAEPCTVVAMRQDGMLRTMSDLVPIEPTPGRDVIVDIAIPEARRGGLGIQIRETDLGIVIDGLVEGGPATRAGLLEGDVVVAVDGEPADDLTIGEFVQAVGGESGTDVTLVVDRGGSEVEVTVTRQVLETPG